MKTKVTAFILALCLALSPANAGILSRGMDKAYAAEEKGPEDYKYKYKNGDYIISFHDERNVDGYCLTLRSVEGERSYDFNRLSSDDHRYTIESYSYFYGRKVEVYIKAFNRTDYGVPEYDDRVDRLGTFVAPPDNASVHINIDLGDKTHLYISHTDGADGHQVKYKLKGKKKTIWLKKDKVEIDIPKGAKGVKFRAFKKYKGKKLYSAYCKL